MSVQPDAYTFAQLRAEAAQTQEGFVLLDAAIQHFQALLDGMPSIAWEGMALHLHMLQRAWRLLRYIDPSEQQ